MLAASSCKYLGSIFEDIYNEAYKVNARSSSNLCISWSSAQEKKKKNEKVIQDDNG